MFSNNAIIQRHRAAFNQNAALRHEENSMPSLSPKENYLRCLRHEEYEYVPLGRGADAGGAGFFPSDCGDASTGFMDGFGVHWVVTPAAPGGLIPEPGNFVLKDVTRWKKDITIPDVEKYDWEKIAGTIRFPVDRDKAAFGITSTCGPWERLAALMGFEEAMIAMMEEPEACHDLLTAITDYKIALAKKTAQYFKPDTFTNFDDIATQRNLFMSPETYRQLIKPQHTRLNKAVRDLGIIPIQHTCGHAELCVEDYIETGAAAWNTVQTSNDIASLLDRYGSKFCFEGGFDMNGAPGCQDATVAEVVAEVERCFREYGGKKGYVFSGMVLLAEGTKDAAEKNAAIVETAKRLRQEVKIA
jgi:uroporphyrinogen-III decarboxylase